MGLLPIPSPRCTQGQVVRVSGELLPCMTRGSSHRPLRLLTGSPSMPHEPSRVVSRRGICLHAVQHGGVSCIGFTNPSVDKSGHAWQLRTEPLCSVPCGAPQVCYFFLTMPARLPYNKRNEAVKNVTHGKKNGRCMQFFFGGNVV